MRRFLILWQSFENRCEDDRRKAVKVKENFKELQYGQQARSLSSLWIAIQDRDDKDGKGSQHTDFATKNNFRY
jgi:hypothetical protein